MSKTETSLQILVTGSSGFIGKPLVEKLASQGYSVHGLDRIAPTNRENLTSFTEMDLTDKKNRLPLVKTLEGIDLVIHLAAARADWGLSEEEFYRDNIEATKSILVGCKEKNVREFFHYSTVGVLPRTGEPLDELVVPRPETTYGRTKLISEELVKDAASSGIFKRVFIMRPSAVFGVGQPPDTNLYRLIDMIRRNRFLMIGAGEEVKTTSHLATLVEATIWLIENIREPYSLWHYVDQPKMATNELVSLCYKEIHNSRPRLRLPLQVVSAIAGLSDLLGNTIGVDLPITRERIKKFCTPTNFSADKIIDAGFSPEISYRAALKETIHWQLGKSESGKKNE